jgi:hypothetical protein
MKPEIYQEFPEAKDKVVEIVELSAEENHFGLAVRLKGQDRPHLLDRTLLHYDPYLRGLD